MFSRDVVFAPGESYHVYNRGANRDRVFFDRETYLMFLRRWREYVPMESASVLAYCLMPNHYHTLVTLRANDFVERMQRFGTSFTKAVNSRFHRTGVLFEGRFKAIHVDDESYLLHLTRYLHLNPVVANLVAATEDWELSSYCEYIGRRSGTLPQPEKILAVFGDSQRYRQFVESRLSVGAPDISHLMFD
jgi:REP-associated tyrosine transposase